MLSSEHFSGSFGRLSHELEIDSIGFWLSESLTAAIINQMLDRVKLGAKILARTAGIKHSVALGHIAVAVGFPNWHGFNAHLVSISAVHPSEVSVESIDRLTKSLIFLIETNAEVSLSAHQEKVFQEFGEKLSRASGLPFLQVMDTVCAGYCGGTSWSEVKGRSPLNATQPLYEFEVIDPKDGRFVMSEACRQLTSSLDAVYQHARTPERIAKAQRWMEDALDRQPDFFEAGLCLAQIHYDNGETNKALRILNVHIKNAERLIQKGYRGKIDWGWATNRFYHRLIWLRMTIYHDVNWMRYCLRDARKQLRLNPRDNLGVRDIYPLMLMEVGEYEKAAKASRFPREDGYHIALVRAFGRFAVGDHPGFIQNMAKALFDLPILRLLLLESPDELPDGDSGFRSVKPDLDTLQRFAWPPYKTVPGLETACVRFLSNPSVQDAEAELRAYWMRLRGIGQVATGDAEGWHELSTRLKSSIPILLAGDVL